ncbi:uncharacterized protein LOC122074318 [Macadamia integrifolia]|uniref:uncharacterized protein LOC122074318 n=1 Tax=Macadamia integrifolia TaxID=60698 RepID=UPI001C4F0F8A|nr:uncharacterized protein LOC122074318 [Macadamia integrifolia]
MDIHVSHATSPAWKGNRREEEEEEEVEYLSRRQKWRNEWRKREFPPPLPVVVKTEKDSARQDHVPWVLKKYSYGDNGRDEGGGNRVVVIEERVKHRKYFRAHRSNGHLTLQLICVDDEEDANVKGDETPRVGTENVEQEFYETDETEEAEIMAKEFEPDQDDEMGDINPTVEASWMQGSSLESKSNGGVAKGKCWTVSGSVGRRSNSDLFRMAIPSMRPIHG